MKNDVNGDIRDVLSLVDITHAKIMAEDAAFRHVASLARCLWTVPFPLACSACDVMAHKNMPVRKHTRTHEHTHTYSHARTRTRARRQEPLNMRRRQNSRSLRLLRLLRRRHPMGRQAEQGLKCMCVCVCCVCVYCICLYCGTGVHLCVNVCACLSGCLRALMYFVCTAARGADESQVGFHIAIYACRSAINSTVDETM
jgi:Flp pilus assembly protein TadB